MMVEGELDELNWKEALARIGERVQSSAENLAWINDGEAEKSTSESARKRKSGSESAAGNAKKKRVNRKYALDFEGRTMRAIKGKGFVEGRGGKSLYALEALLSQATVALHTQDEDQLRRLSGTCVQLARDNGAASSERDAGLWAQELLCQAYCVKTIMR